MRISDWSSDVCSSDLYADQIDGGEVVFEQYGSKLVVNPEHLPMLEGMTLDFQKQGLNEAFKFVNPNVKGECGWGESFTVCKRQVDDMDTGRPICLPAAEEEAILTCTGSRVEAV